MSCVPVEVEVEQDEFQLDAVAFGVCFLFGLLIGAGLLLCLGWFCIKDIKSRREPDSEKAKREEDEHDRVTVVASKSRPVTAVSRRSSKKKRMQSARKKKGGGDGEPLVPITVASVVEEKPEDVTTTVTEKKDELGRRGGGGGSGMVEALVAPTAAAMDVELAGQDVDAIYSLERELKAESIMTGIQILRSLLGQQLSKGRVTEDQYKDMLQDAQANITAIIAQQQEEQQQEEQEINKKVKDPAKRQQELDGLHGKYATKMNTLLNEEKEKMRHELQKKTDLSEDEIEKLLGQYTKQMASLESKLGVERARQAANLEERLARRKYLAGMHENEKAVALGAVEHRKDTSEQMLASLVSDGKLSDKQRDDLLRQYDADVNRLNTQNQLEFEKQRGSLAEKLRRAREERMARLDQDQEKERDDFVKRTEQTKPSDVVDQYHAMLQQQREQRHQLSDQLDDREAQQVTQLLQEQEARKQDELEKKEAEFQKKVKSQGSLTDGDMRRLVDIHEAEMQEYERVKNSERKKMSRQLEQKLAERKKKAEEQLAQNEAEQVTVREQQDDTIKKVLESQKELSSEARNEIMAEHERNMTAIQNQLQLSKLRQQKLLEQKMAAKRGKVEELRAKQEEVARNKRQYKQAELDKLQAQLEKQVEEEEARLDKVRKDMINELRQRMALETEQALAEQDRQMGALIGRLQVGQARRQAIITKQDKTLKELENKLASQVDERSSATSSPSDNQQVDYLLKQHHRDVNELNEQLDDAKARQQAVIRDRLEAKRAHKEREVENKMAKEFEDGRKRGALISTSILSSVMLEQRHKMEIKRLEKEMEVEMQKQREQLNAQLEEELQQELENRKKNFLAQIAAIKGMSKSEVNQLVDTAVIDAGGDEREAKKLRKEFNTDVQRAKTDLGVDDREPGYSRRRLPPLRNTTRSNNGGYHGNRHSRDSYHDRYRDRSASDDDDSDYHDNRRSRGVRYRGYREQETSSESEQYYDHF